MLQCAPYLASDASATHDVAAHSTLSRPYKTHNGADVHRNRPKATENSVLIVVYGLGLGFVFRFSDAVRRRCAVVFYMDPTLCGAHTHTHTTRGGCAWRVQTINVRPPLVYTRVHHQ